MKVETKATLSMDGVGARTPVLAGLMNRYRNMVKSQPTSIAKNDTPEVSLQPGARQAELVEFFRLYESLIEVLCDAAQFGISPAFERKFQGARQDMVNRYASIRVFLGAYLRPSVEDGRGAAHGIRFDAFDALLAPSSLELFLQADDGFTISRITRTREALNLYAEHLRHLIQRTR